MERDRLKKHLKKKALTNTVFVLLGITIIGVLLFMFGTQLLINFSVLLTKGGNEQVNSTEDVSYIAAPDFDPIEEATNSAVIAVSGYSSVDDAQIKLYVNDVLEGTEKVNDKNEFRFANVQIEEGDNEIKAKTVTNNGKESSFTAPYTVNYSKEPPEVTIEYPADGQTLKQEQQRIRGKTKSGATVTVNGFRAIVEPNGNFSYNIKLNQGGNSLKVVATDPAGNKSEKEINVTYAP